MMLLMVALLRRSAGTGAPNVVGCDPVMRKGPIRGSALGGELHLTGPHLNPPNQTRNTIMLHPSVEALRCDSKEIAGMPPFSAESALFQQYLDTVRALRSPRRGAEHLHL